MKKLLTIAVFSQTLPMGCAQHQDVQHRYSHTFEEDCGPGEEARPLEQSREDCKKKNQNYLFRADTCVSSQTPPPMIPEKMMLNTSAELEEADCVTAHLAADDPKLENVTNYSASHSNLVGNSKVCQATLYQGNYISRNSTPVGRIHITSPRIPDSNYSVDVQLKSNEDDSSKTLSFKCAK